MGAIKKLGQLSYGNKETLKTLTNKHQNFMGFVVI